MKKIAIIILSLMTYNCLYGQQQPLNSLFDWNSHNLNPAFSSLQDSSFACLSYRKQWAGLSTTPTTVNASGFGQVGGSNGVSALIMHDKLGGSFTSNLIQLGYSRKIDLSSDLSLAFGLAGIVNQYSFNPENVELIQQDDPSFLNAQNASGLDANFGLLLQGKSFYLGVGGQQLLQSQLSRFNEVPGFNNTLGRVYFSHAAYRWKLSRNVIATPAILFKTNTITPAQVDLQTTLKFNDLIAAGINYRIDQGPSFLLQLTQDRLFFGYAYDIPTGNLGKYNSGSHEFVVGYNLSGKDNQRDSDKDGITDKKDKCPNDPGATENKGCPWPDTDGDGVTDNVDQCPDRMGSIENSGCPSLDSDGDGIADEFDDCPLTKGEADNEGCPVVTETQKSAIERAITTLEFESGKAIILKSSYSALDILAIILQEKPDWTLQLSGHTDDVGDATENFNLSKNRAEAVASYLVEKGAAEPQITILFFGESKPIADNTTEEGRKLNRRVEMKFVFK
jgi:type IX secretion system PorP/SprF family membrane protein